MTADTSHTTDKNRPSDELPQRECVKYGKHEAHIWKSFVLNANAVCMGSGTPHAGGTWKPVKKTDYSEGWRKDYSRPMSVKEARKIAFDMHSKQKDKAGEPYAQHLEAVRMGVVVLGGGVEEQVAALFHDAVEDFHTTYEHLRKIGCTEDTITMIEAVSKRTSEEQGVYLDRIIKAGPGAMRVKLADLLHNTRHDRMEALKNTPNKGQATVDRLLKKYRPAMARLLLELNMIVDEDEQKKLATKPSGSAGSWSGTGYYGSTGKDGATQYSVDGLIAGDWPKIFAAPILRKLERTDTQQVFLLCNGEVRAEDLNYSNSKTARKLSTLTQGKWEGRAGEDIEQYLDALDEQKSGSQSWQEQDTSASLWE